MHDPYEKKLWKNVFLKKQYYQEHHISVPQ
jgi:hypothetical protein